MGFWLGYLELGSWVKVEEWVENSNLEAVVFIWGQKGTQTTLGIFQGLSTSSHLR